MKKIDAYLEQAISIHAPREGSDARICSAQAICLDFNPRSP